MARSPHPEHLVIIGAGPAGLGAARELTRHKSSKPFTVTLFDKNEIVGGLARSHEYKGYHFDVGPHRFFTKNKEVLALWQETLGGEFIKVPRLTRILYRNKLFLYPINLTDVIRKIGPVDSVRCLASYIKAKALLYKTEPRSFEEWITKEFGRKLYLMFFKTYTEKVWGIPCQEIGAEWAAQRIKNLNFSEVIKTAILGSKRSSAKSLVNVFYYPTKGAGMMYERLADVVKAQGHQLQLGHTVEKISHTNGRIVALTSRGSKGALTQKVDHLFSSMPLTHLISVLDPLPPAEILEAAKQLYYRDHITVNLIVDRKNLFPDNWIYVHSPEVKMARIANYNNFSDQMRPVPDHAAISVEYFVFKEDELWNLPDEKLISLATEEMAKVGLLKAHEVIDGFVIRESESYPTYYTGHREPFELLKKYAESFSNLQLIGRGGMYKYNNMDHSLYTGMLAARNYLAGKRRYDVWQVNEDAEYLEEEK